MTDILNAIMLVGALVVAIYGVVFVVGLLACQLVLVGYVLLGVATPVFGLFRRILP